MSGKGGGGGCGSGGGGGECVGGGWDEAKGSEWGWEFWHSVYWGGEATADLRREMGRGWRWEPRLGELLSGEAVQRTRVEIRGLAGLKGRREVELKKCLERSLGEGSVLAVRIRSSASALVEFYRAEVAAEAVAKGAALFPPGTGMEVVRAGPRFPPLPSMESRGLGWGEKLRAEHWERAEQGLSLNQLIARLLPRLRAQPLRLDDAWLGALVAKEASASLKEHLGLWPAGALRGRAELSLWGPLIGLGGCGMVEMLLPSLALPETEPWEPFPIHHIRSLHGALVYMEALVGEMGPLSVADSRLHLLLRYFPQTFSLPNHAKLREQLLQQNLLLLHSVLFRIDLPAHRLALASALTKAPSTRSPTTSSKVPKSGLLKSSPADLKWKGCVLGRGNLQASSALAPLRPFL